MPTTMERFSGAVPFEGYGGADPYDWYFRFRGDCAFLEVHERVSPDVYPVPCVLSASRYDVTGNPYCGDLADGDSLDLFCELWGELTPPVEGSRYHEVLSSAVDALLSATPTTHDDERPGEQVA